MTVKEKAKDGDQQQQQKMLKSMTVLKIKLLDPPIDELLRIAVECRRARNAAAENWLLRERGMPETDAQAKINAKSGKPLTPQTKLYHSVRCACPDLSSNVASKVANEVWQHLNARLPWTRRDLNSDGPPARRSDAILSYDDRPPFFSGLEIPIYNCRAAVEWSDDGELFLLTGPLIDGASMRLQMSLKGVPRAIQRKLRQISDGRRKLCDSSVRLWRDQWFWFVPVQDERPALDADRVLTLTPNHEADSRYPLLCRAPAGRNWGVGDGGYLLGQMRRLIALRKTVGYRYRVGLSGGHGRQKYDAIISKRMRQLSNVRDEFRRKLITDIVRQCERHECGTVLFREPTNPAKRLLWFELNGAQFDWTRFLTDLKNRLHRHGIQLQKKKLKIAELLPEKEAIEQ